ncbi:MAG: hypothetical protein OEM41_08075 [Ignavibacteria bacterium]|nr:hypothetical protein [Ignavibacteria bacterium]
MEHTPEEGPTTWETFLHAVVSPEAVLSHIAETPLAHLRWLVPVLLYIVVSVSSIQVLALSPALNQAFRETIDEVLRPSLDEQIREGALTQNQADWLYKFVSPGTPHFLLAQGTGLVLGAFATLFALAFLFWQLGKSAMSSQAPYMKVVEVVGMTYVIASLERIVTTLLMMGTESIYATPSLGLLAIPSAPQSLSFLLLSRVNLFTLWELGFISRGLSFLLDRDFPKVLVLIIALWLIWSAVTLIPLFNPGG